MHSVSKNLQRDEEPGERDPKQRPLQGAFLIPPVLPVVLIFSELGMVSPELCPRTEAVPNQPILKLRSRAWFSSRALLLCEQGSDFGNKLRGDCHERNPLILQRCLDLDELLVLRLAFVVSEDLSDPILVPAGWKLLLPHLGFLRCRRRNAFFALPCSS